MDSVTSKGESVNTSDLTFGSERGWGAPLTRPHVGLGRVMHNKTKHYQTLPEWHLASYRLPRVSTLLVSVNRPDELSFPN
jgi:hypothetical protein